MKVLRTRLADEDLLDIWAYIFQDNPEAANSLVEKLIQRCETLGAHPELGVKRDDLVDGLRSLIEGNYTIFYRLSGDTVQVLRILHGARDFQALF